MDPLTLTSILLSGSAAVIPVLAAKVRRSVSDARAAEGDRDKLTDQYNELARRHNRLLAKVRELSAQSAQLEKYRARLRHDGIVEHYMQPVVLVGPRGVGKSSLLRYWRSPWEVTPTSPTFRRERVDVPVCMLPNIETRVHPDDPELVVPIHANLMLRVHDFAGEVEAQRMVSQVLMEETRLLRQTSHRELGVVVICMFDAAEAVSGIQHETRKYYNGELFGRLRGLVSEQAVSVERLILVFNKVDNLRLACESHYTDEDILRECMTYFLGTFPDLHYVCNEGRMRTMLTMLNSLDGHDRVRGASGVLGEASRPIVEAYDANLALRPSTASLDRTAHEGSGSQSGIVGPSDDVVEVS